MLDYKFLITKTSRGAPVNIWQDYNGQDFWKLVRVSGSLEEKATVTVLTLDQRKACFAGQAADLPLVTQEIRYRAPGAAEVWLGWGLEGWQAIPEAARPPGTVLKNGMMHTHMVREGNTFTTTLRVPPGTGLDFWFSLPRRRRARPSIFGKRKTGRVEPCRGSWRSMAGLRSSPSGKAAPERRVSSGICDVRREAVPCSRPVSNN
jgi:hypothetical protein